ncbi:hypothetical protein V5O48_017313 [Marasmius crinis-equi]|uniref:Uncharacterized protein n=1 Tax=Marasmius crinis-equi TaxID=585013 RepID=A0ABR3EPC4_9AGAR
MPPKLDKQQCQIARAKGAYRGAYMFNYLNNDTFGFINDGKPLAFGDPLAQQLQHILTYQSVFYGDHFVADFMKTEMEDPFMVYRIAPDIWFVSDLWWEQLDPEAMNMMVSGQSLRDPDWNAGAWFNGLRREWGGLPAVEGNELYNWSKGCMRDVYMNAIQFILNSSYRGHVYPGDDLPISPEAKPVRSVRFRAIPMNDKNTEYLIHDKWRNLKFVLSWELLEEPRLDLV